MKVAGSGRLSTEDAAFIHLETPRLRLRRFFAGDAAALASYRSDPEVARLQGWEAPYSLGAAREFVESLKAVSPGEPGVWFQFAVAARSDDALVGDCALRATRTDPRQGELGFSFATDHQGQGYAAEAVRGVVAYAFGRLGMHRVFSITDVRNERAQRLLERTGFRREAHFVEGSWFKGEWASEFLYAQLAAEWRRGG